MNISSEQLQAIDSGQAVSLTVEGRACVLLPGRMYDQLFDDWHPAIMERPTAEIMAEDWADPAMDVYDE